MKLDRRNIQKILFIGSVLILLYLGLQHMNIVFEFLTWMLYVMMPFIAAVCFTFFLNVPLKAIERHLFQPKKGKTVKPIFEKMRRPVALVLSMLLFIAIITVFLLIIIPKLGESLNTIIKSVPGAIDSLVAFVNDLSESNEYVKNIISNLEIQNAVITNTQPKAEHIAFLFILSAKMPMGSCIANAKKLYVIIDKNRANEPVNCGVTILDTNMAQEKSTTK